MEFYAEREKVLQQRTQQTPQTLEQLYNEWMKNHVDKQLRSSTKMFYENLWNAHLHDKGKLKLKSITPKHIFDILDGVCGEKMTTECARQGVYKTLRAIFSKGVKWGCLESNPCDRVDPPKYKPKEKQVYEQDTLQKMFEALSREEVKYQAMIYFAVMCGLRKQEIVGLKWSDINKNENKFIVQRAATRLPGKGTFATDTKNNSSIRTIALPSVLSAALKIHYTEQAKKRLKTGDKWINEEWIFTQWNGTIMDIDTSSKWWAKFIKRTGLPPVTFHCLRHTAATYLINSGIDVSTVSGILGHAQKSTTLNVYSHVIADAKTEAINTLEEAMLPKVRKISNV